MILYDIHMIYLLKWWVPVRKRLLYWENFGCVRSPAGTGALVPWAIPRGHPPESQINGLVREKICSELPGFPNLFQFIYFHGEVLWPCHTARGYLIGKHSRFHQVFTRNKCGFNVVWKKSSIRVGNSPASKREDTGDWKTMGMLSIEK